MEKVSLSRLVTNDQFYAILLKISNTSFRGSVILELIVPILSLYQFVSLGTTSLEFFLI